MYFPQRVPLFNIDPVFLSTILATVPSPPVFPTAEPFIHPFGSNINSRKPAPKRERFPEWYNEQETVSEPAPPSKAFPRPKQGTSPSPSKSPVTKKLLVIDRSKIKNLPENLLNIEVEENYSKIDQAVEEKLKQSLDEDERVPEWDSPDSPDTEVSSSKELLGPVRYLPHFLDAQAKQGNPFARIIIENSQFDSTGALCPIPYSKPFEKVWHYKDPQSKVQGPFSSIQMFNWMAAGYFKDELEVAHTNTTHFAPLYMYVLQARRNSESQPDEQATSVLKNILGLGFSND